MIAGLRARLDRITGRDIMDRHFAEMAKFEGHARYDPISLRVIPSAESLESLPVRLAGHREIWTAQEDWFFNPVDCYPPGVRALPNEVGHDRHRRYVRVPGTP